MQGESNNTNQQSTIGQPDSQSSAQSVLSPDNTPEQASVQTNMIDKIDKNAPMYEPKKNRAKTFASVLSVLFLVGGLVTTVYLVQQQQEIRREASGVCTVGITQCSGFDQVAKCIPAGTECPTREENKVYNYPSWCDIAKECSQNEKCLEGACVQITQP